MMRRNEPALALAVALLLAAAAPTLAAEPARAPPSDTVACTGEDDDAPALNAALSRLRARTPVSAFAWPVGRAGRLTVQGARCRLRTTVDLTHLYGSGLALDLWGVELVCQTAKAPCLDATGSGQMSLLGLNLIGDCKKDTPEIGLVLARKTESLSEGADHNYLDHPTIAGCFGLAAFFNRSSETTLVVAGAFYNYRDRAYAAIYDGTNAFGFQSAFYAERYPVGTFSSFNENTCDTCIFETFGHASVPLWIGGAVRHKFINGYALATAADGGPAVTLSFANAAPNDFLELKLHVENGSLGAAILITGVEHPTLHGLRLEDSYPSQNGPVFVRDKGVKQVTIEDADFHIGRMPQPLARGWDDPAAYDVSGALYSQDARFKAPARFSGLVCASGKCSLR